MRVPMVTLLVLAFLWGDVQGQPSPGGGSPGGGMRDRFPGTGGRSGGRSFFGDPNEFFNRLANGKEVINRTEISNPMMASMFDRIAERAGITNGQLTRQQFTSYIQQRMSGGSPGMTPAPTPSEPGVTPGAPPGTTPASPGGGPPPDFMAGWAEGMFRRSDQNGDGLLNFDELPESIRGEREKWDANRDGFVDLAEFKTYFQARVQQFQAERGQGGGGFPGWDMLIVPAPAEEEERRPVVYRAGKLPKELPSWFQQLDNDNDAQIGLYEWKSSGRSLDEFRELDRNGDGFLIVEEVLRAKAALKESTASREPSGPGLASGESRDRRSFGRDRR